MEVKGDDESDSSTAKNTGPDDRIASRPKRYVDVLCDSCCRQILYYLADRAEESASVDAVARHLTALETGYAPETLIKADFADVRREVSRKHLPKMADYGIIDFDVRRRKVRLRQSSPVFVVFLRICERLERLG